MEDKMGNKGKGEKIHSHQRDSMGIPDQVLNKMEEFVFGQNFYVFTCDTEGNLLYINKRKESLIPQLIRDVPFPFGFYLTKKQRFQFLEAIRNCINNPDTCHILNLEYVLKDSESITIHWELQSIIGMESNSRVVLGIGMDITDYLGNTTLLHVLVEKSAQQTNRINSFNYIVSHHIRSQAANIIGLLELIDLSQEEQGEMAEYIHFLNISANKLDLLSRNLAKSLTAELPLFKPQTSKGLNKCVSRVLKLLQPSIEENNVTVELHLDRLHMVTVVPEYINSVLLHLITNAIKFRDPNRRAVLRISSELNDEFILLTITDNGLGMDMGRVREKLFSFHETFHNRQEGRGFGLHISKIQMEQMGGKMEVESTPGKGTTFSLYFRRG